MFGAPAPTDLEVFPENWEAVNVFLACGTQWRYRERTITGLEYASVEAVLRLRAIKAASETFERVRIMELAVLNALSEKQ